MTIKFYLHHAPDDYGWSFELEVVEWCLSTRIDAASTLLYEVDKAARGGYKLSSHRLLSLFEVQMSRKAKSNGAASNNGVNRSSRTGGDAKWVWANCKLSDEDNTNLADSETTLEYLATSIVALGNDGLGVTIKPVDSGESICVTIYRPNFPDAGTTVGVSAFAGNIRDAILACLYKLDTYGGGDFSGFDLESGSSGARPRFR